MSEVTGTTNIPNSYSTGWKSVRDVSVPAATAPWIAARERATSRSRYAWARLMPNSASQYDSQLGSLSSSAC